MIFGVGVDIVKVSRLQKWVADIAIIERFFNKNEMSSSSNQGHLCEHYAARFAAKEAFSKALGTGLQGFALRDVFIKARDDGSPALVVEGGAKELMQHRCPGGRAYVSLSHEREYAIAFVVIEK